MFADRRAIRVISGSRISMQAVHAASLHSESGPGSLWDVKKGAAVFGGPVDLLVDAAVSSRIDAIQVLVADQTGGTGVAWGVGVVGMRRDRGVVGIVGNLCGQLVVEGIVVLHVDPLVGWIGHLVAAVVTHFVGVQALCLFEHVLGVVFHPCRLPSTNAH